MKANIRISGTAIAPSREMVDNGDGTFNLLADITSAVTIHPGRFARIPTALWVGGDDNVLALVNIHAGHREDADPNDVQRSGRFVLISQTEQVQIVVDIINETSNPILISPTNSIGSLAFRHVSDDPAESEPAAGRADDGHVLPIVFEPKHLGQDMRPSYATSGSAAFDLRADVPETVLLGPGERMLVPTGIRMAIPNGHEGQIRPRSGLALKHGISITNSPATIDSDYRGEIGVVLHNLGHEPFAIATGDRIAQFLIAPVVLVDMDFRDGLDDTSRSTGGFGSTGTR